MPFKRETRRMFDPEQSEGTEWYVYAETCETGSDKTSTRAQRLLWDPDQIFTDAADVANWVREMTNRYATRTTVHLSGGGIGETGDETNRDEAYERDSEVLARGDSLYVDFRHGTGGRMYLWAEAVRPEDRKGVQRLKGE